MRDQNEIYSHENVTTRSQWLQILKIDNLDYQSMLKTKESTCVVVGAGATARVLRLEHFRWSDWQTSYWYSKHSGSIHSLYTNSLFFVSNHS